MILILRKSEYEEIIQKLKLEMKNQVEENACIEKKNLKYNKMMLKKRNNTLDFSQDHGNFDFGSCVTDF